MGFKNKYLPITTLLLAFTTSPLAAQDKPTFEERIPQKILSKENQFLTFTLENDLFGAGTDENYTSGARLSYFKVGSKPHDLVKSALEVIPGFEITDKTAVTYSIGHNLYTPEDITRTVPDPNDRPYASFLYGSAGLTNIKDNHIDELELTLGIVGPAALGEEIQKTVHKYVKSDDPKGWDYQLKNEPAINLTWQRRFPEQWTEELNYTYLRAQPYGGITLGNIYTHASAGMTFQLTPKRYQWQSQPLRVKPAIPGTGFFDVPQNHFAWSLFAGLEGRAVGRNIFLDGNTFKDSPSVDKKHFVADANIGASISYGPTQLSYTLNWRSKEFEGQDDASLFGAVSIGYRY